MGALHEGHMSLARLCGPCDVRVLSIFVNPTQFGPNEDLTRYPRTLENDLELCEHEGIDFVFAPSVDDMYHSDSGITVNPGAMGKVWEGAIRPGHFEGVLTIVAKLLHLVRPDAANFGEKDFQQLTLIRAMCRSLDWPVSIVAGQTLRESDGLAMSSRNRFLKESERAQANVLYKALLTGRDLIQSGERDVEKVKQIMLADVSKSTDAQVEYLTGVNSETLVEEAIVPENARLIGAIRLGSVRLIDNMAVYDA